MLWWRSGVAVERKRDEEVKTLHEQISEALADLFRVKTMPPMLLQ